jgi:hypothetical protein
MRPVDSKMKHASSIDQRLIVAGHMELEALLPCLARPELTYRQ